MRRILGSFVCLVLCSAVGLGNTRETLPASFPPPSVFFFYVKVIHESFFKIKTLQKYGFEK